MVGGNHNTKEVSELNLE